MALILILNCDNEAAEAMALLLVKNGHRVRCCARPHQALRHCRLTRFDLLWMAVPLLGPLAGEPLVFLRRLRRVRLQLPVMVIGGEAMSPELRWQLKAHGVRGFLRRNPKPHLVVGVTDILTRGTR